MNLDSDVAAALGRTWIDDRPWDLLTDLTAIGDRMGGSEGERRAADLVAQALDDAGVRELDRQPFETARWVRGSSSLDLLTPRRRTFEAVALPYAPAAEVRGELVDVGYGTPAEIDEVSVEGRVAVASTTTPPGGRFVHRMEKFGYALDSGAVGFVFANHAPGQLPPTGALRFDEEAAAPAVGVSAETGAWLREYAVESVTESTTPSVVDSGDRTGEVGEVRLSVEAETRPGESQNVLGRLGPDTDEEVLLVAHYDAHDVGEGALDNGCGVAVVVCAARILTAMDLPVGVRVAVVGCEETGLVGSNHLADTFDTDRVRAVVNVDGAGRHRDLVAMTHTSAATGAVARRVASETRQPIRVEDEPHPFSDQWPFVRRGVPALQLHSASGERGRGWGHTAADTRDKVDDRIVREHGMLTALLVRDLTDPGVDLPRLDSDDLRESFRTADFETGMRAAGLWPSGWE